MSAVEVEDEEIHFAVTSNSAIINCFFIITWKTEWSIELFEIVSFQHLTEPTTKICNYLKGTRVLSL